MLFLYSKRLHEQKNITTVNSVTNTWSIQQTPMFHGCTIQINKTLSLENFRSNDLNLAKRNPWFSSFLVSSNIYAKYKMSYITNLVCYTYFHWFFNPQCQHIFGKQTGYIFQSPKPIKTWTTKHYASLNQWYNTNNKCIFTKLNAVFILKTAAWTKKYYNG